MSVSVFQWPCGTFETRRSPRGERPWCRTIFVVTAVSSMNTRRGASRRGCSAFNSARAAATSGRSCSAACRVFFEGDVVTFVEAPDRANTGFVLLHGAQPRTNLLKRQVRLRGNQIEQPLPVLLEPRAACQASPRRYRSFANDLSSESSSMLQDQAGVRLRGGSHRPRPRPPHDLSSASNSPLP